MRGKFLIDRKIFESEIWEKPSGYIKVWLWLIGKCNFKDVRKGGQIFRRGECLITFEETKELLRHKIGYRWSKKPSTKSVWSIYEYLRRRKQIETTKTTIGMWVKVLNYDQYQQLPRREKDDEGNRDRVAKETAKGMRRKQQGNTINKNDNNEKRGDFLLR